MTPDPISIDEARTMRDLLHGVAKDAPVRHYRYLLKAQAHEWGRAVDEFEEMEGEGVIELAGSLVPGMYVVGVDDHDQSQFMRIVRRTRGGDLSFELENPTSWKPIYKGYGSPTSPAVVRR